MPDPETVNRPRSAACGTSSSNRRAAELHEKIGRILSDQVAIVEGRFDTMARLDLSEVEYRALVEVTIERIASLSSRLSEARASGSAAEAISTTHLLREPAEILGAQRCLNAIGGVEGAGNAWQADRALALVSLEVATLQEVLAGLARPWANRATSA